MALVHDELTRRGGAEVVLEEMVRVFPQADVFTLYAGTPKMVVGGQEIDINTSFLQKFPLWFKRHPGRVLMFLPHAAEQFDLSEYDLVVSSASSFAKSVVTRINVPHICYCHTPTRYLWNSTHEIIKKASFYKRPLLRVLLHCLRLSDYAAAQRVDYFLANSQYTKHRIYKYYRRFSEVVYPPIDTSFFYPCPGDYKKDSRGYFLVVGRLSSAKNFDQAIRVCDKLGFRLAVVGSGPEERRLRKIAGGHVFFKGSVNNEELRKYYRNAWALLQPGEEDFGMAAAEALGCGTPIIGYGRGGAKEIVEDGVTGVLYNEPREEMLADAIRWYISKKKFFDLKKARASVLKYSRENFAESLKKCAQTALANKE